MKNRAEVIVEKLTHALAFVSEARHTPHYELIRQHLEDIERLLEAANTLAKEEVLKRMCDCGAEVTVTKPTPESIAWTCPHCGGNFMEADV